MARTPKTIRKNKMGYILMMNHNIDLPENTMIRLKDKSKGKSRLLKKFLKKREHDIVIKAQRKRKLKRLGLTGFDS